MCDGPRRVLFVDSGSGISGGQYSLLEIFKTIDKSRFTPMAALAPASGLGKKCDELDIPWFELPFQSAHASCDVGMSFGARVRDIWRSLAGIRTLAGLIRRERVEIIHANSFKASLVASFAALITRRPMVFNDRIMLRHWPLGNLVALISSRVIAVCEAVRDKHGWPVRRKVIVIPSGIDTTRFSPVGQDRPSKRVCYFGRMTEEKGIDTLVEAAAIVVGKVPEARFLLAGSPFTTDDGLYLDKIKRLITKLGLEESIEFAGQVDDIPGLLGGCDLVVLPSRREAVGRAVLEAGAMGKPVVASATGGLCQSVIDGDTGILVPPGDAGGFADAIVKLLVDKDLAARMGRRGRENIASNYSSEQVTRRIMAVYDQILISPNSKKGSGTDS